MSIPTLTERLSVVEKELAEIKNLISKNESEIENHLWDKVFGSFEKSEGFDEAVRLGREYREGFRPRNYKEES